MSVFDYKKALSNIPHKPGVYQYYDADEELIYIGKAKDLRNRVGSYFNQDAQLNGKTRVLVSKIRRVSFTIVDTEIDAWLLENNLIKKHQPRYNILLKDDKTYPWIIIKKEHFPRIYATRKFIKDGSTYFGPYASLSMMYTILDFIKETYPLRNCNLALSPQNINDGKFKVCLEYQIGNCKGPCQNYQTKEDYDKSIEEITAILNGKIGSVIKNIKEVIKNAVEDLNFELAHSFQIKLQELEKYQSKSTIVSSAITNLDVVSIASDERYAFVNYLKVMNGSIIQTQTIEIKKRLDETDEELLTLAITEFRTKFKSTSKEIIVPFPIPLVDENLKFVVPKLGEKKKLLELSEKNVVYFKRDKLNHYEKLNPDLIYANTILSLNFAKNFNCKKIISIHEHRSLYYTIEERKNDYQKFDKIIVGCDKTKEILNNHGLNSNVIPYYINFKDNDKKNKNQKIIKFHNIKYIKIKIKK
jgi:excinuclease ABC subunit C